MSPESLSPSQINLYLTCSLKYRFQYIDRLPKLTHSANLVFGGAIHAALEWLHKERKKGKPPPLDEILRVFEADWNAQIWVKQWRLPITATVRKRWSVKARNCSPSSSTNSPVR